MENINNYLDLPYNYVIQPVDDESGKYYYAKI